MTKWSGAGLVLTTNPGLEELAFDELCERAAAMGVSAESIEQVPAGIRGRLQVQASGEECRLLEAAWRMRSIHNVLQPLAHFELPATDALGAISKVLEDTDIPGLEHGEACFRISSDRRGKHPFTSREVEQVAGAAIVARTGAPVDLTDFSVEVCVDVIEQTCTVSLRLTRKALSYRHEQPFHNSASLRTNVAYALLRIAGLGSERRRLADPFCGTGTILQEAGSLLPEAELWGSDWSERVVQGARDNLQCAGLSARCRLDCVDARHMSEFYGTGNIDVIATNPPYGRKFGKGMDFIKFYSDFLREAHYVLGPGDRMVLLVHKRGAFNQALLRAGGFRLREGVRIIQISSLYPGIFHLECE